MNGGECFEELLKFDPEAKIILCSGFPQNADVAKMKKNGLLDFIYKPCKSEVLTTVVAKAINKNSNHN
jgi:two-component system chemotaxis response regulator CheY